MDGVGYGAEDDAPIPISELVDDSTSEEVLGTEYGGRVKLEAVEDRRVPVPVGALELF